MIPFIRPLFLFVFFSCLIPNLHSQTISGKITDAESGEELIGANIVFFDSNGIYITGASTDFDANYKVTADSTAAWMEVSFAGYSYEKIFIDGRKTIDINLKEGFMISCGGVITYQIPLINLASPKSGQAVSSDQIRNSPAKDINTIATTFAGLTIIQ